MIHQPAVPNHRHRNDMRSLILWDIDGTLLYGGGISGAIMRDAMRAVYGGESSNERISYAGKTDPQIVLETFPDQTPEQLLGQLAQFSAAYVAAFELRAHELREYGYVLAGVQAVLAALAQRPLIQSVLTGNIQPIARRKLEVMGLAAFFDLAVGAYGSDHHQRSELVPIALVRASQRYGRPFTGADVVVIGDTPNDIACGRAGAARTIAVASGVFSLETLQDCKPDRALASLADTDAAVSAILG